MCLLRTPQIYAELTQILAETKPTITDGIDYIFTSIDREPAC